MFPSDPLEDIEQATENDGQQTSLDALRVSINSSNIYPFVVVVPLLDISQVQCIKSYQAQEHDELTLEKADILHAKTITSDGKNLLTFRKTTFQLQPKLTSINISPGWVEGIRLSDGERGWFPKTYVEEITSRSARLRNLRENIRIKCVTQKLRGND